MDAPVESSSPQGPLISPTPSSGPRRERHSESAGLSGVTLSTPSAAVAPPLAVALLELPPPAPPAPPPLAAAPRRSVPPPVDISSRPFGRRDPLYAHRYTARPRGRTAANSATAPGVDASEPLMRGRSATCSSEGHLCFRCGGPPLASPVPRSRAHDTRRRTRTSLPNAPFRTSSWRFATLCPAPRVRSARWRSVPPPRVYSVWRLPPGLPLPRRRAPRAHYCGRNLVEDEIYDRSRQEITLGNRVPSVAGDAWIAPNATLVGDTDVADQCSVWHGSVLKGDLGAVRLGAFSNVQERCVIDAAGYVHICASPNPRLPTPTSARDHPRAPARQAPNNQITQRCAPPGQPRNPCPRLADEEIFPSDPLPLLSLSLSLSLSLRAARRRASDST